MKSNKKILISSILLIISTLAYVSAILDLFGFNSNLKIGFFILFLTVFSILIFHLSKWLIDKKLSYPREISTGAFLKEEFHSSNNLIVICSAGDQFRHFLAGLDLSQKMSKNLTVEIYFRERINDDSIYKNLDRIRNISNKIGFKAVAFKSEWDSFNLSAIISNNNKAIINFYVRNNNQTFPVWQESKFIIRNKNKYHDDLFIIIDKWIEIGKKRYIKID